jgi:hypothetical protein
MTKPQFIKAEDLPAQNQALNRELESVTQKNQELREAYEDLISKVQDVEKLSNLRGWAVDRAISLNQISRNTDKIPTVGEIKAQAEELALYAYGEEFSRIKEVAKKMGETIQ